MWMTFSLPLMIRILLTGLHLRQTRYIIDLLDRVQLTGIRPYRAPCVSSSKLFEFDGEILPDPSEYRHTVGALQYVILTRPDITYSVNQLCQHLQAPTFAHWTAAKRVLRYLKHTLDHGLFYKPGSFGINVILIGLVILMIDVSFVVMVFLLDTILSPSRLRNNLWYSSPVLKLNTDVWFLLL